MTKAFDSKRLKKDANEIRSFKELTLSKNPDSFISVMAKFCNKQLVLAYPHPIVEWYSYSHPSPGKRIEFAEQWQKQHTKKPCN